MKSKNKSAYNLEEILALRNEELVSNWSKLASLIRAFEEVEWDDAKVKALALMKAGDALEYIEYIREAEAAHPGLPFEPHPRIVSPGKIEDPRPKQVNKANYQKLLLIAPGLESKLESFGDQYFYGKSKKTGYKNLNVELLSKDDTGFYLSIVQYSRHDGKMVPDPVMEILVNPQKRIVEALRFEDANGESEVYDNKYSRELTNKKERKSQNNFLYDWLKELKRQGHKLVWTYSDVSSVIVDQYKKEDKVEESHLRIVPPTEEPENKGEEQSSITSNETEVKEEPETKDEEGLAKIIPLKAGYTEKEREEFVQRFMRVVTLNNRKNFKTIAFEAISIINSGKTIPFLLDSWDKLKDREYNHLIELNYFRLNVIVPDLLERLKQEDGVIRLVSSKTKTAFRIELGDERKENVVVLGIHQMNKKKPEPTLLVKIQKDKGTITSDLSINGFAGLTDFNADAQSRYFEPKYESVLGFERWLKYLVLQEFKPLSVQLKKVEDIPVTESKSEPEETPGEEKKHSKYYINKDIPHMEPGHGWLTEAHKKHGVTQEMIDWINEHDKPIVVIPRKKIMVHNTVDPEADLKKQALGPGLRLSRRFRFYPEGRSNRADRTRNGY